jgi:SAM-dependent methyltransferase
VWHEEGHRFLRCLWCGVVFADLLETTYEEQQRNAWHEPVLEPEVDEFYGAARARAQDTFLERHALSGSRRLLDVGCGLGFFLARAAEAGWDVTGCEPSQFWAARAGARVGSERVLLGTARHHALDGERTPNLAYVLPLYALRRHVLGHSVELGPTNHVVYFTAATMRSALRSTSLRPVSWANFAPAQVVADRHSNVRLLGDRDPVRLLKNTYAELSPLVARATRGRMIVSSDLDVEAVPT